MENRKVLSKLHIAAALFTFMLALLFLSERVYAQDITPPSFQIDFIDVGQGDSALVQCDGHYMLIDGGDASKSSLIYSYLNARAIKYIDIMVATHEDADHIGGLSGALNYATVGTAYCPVTDNDTKAFKSFKKYLSSQGKSITVPRAGETFSLGSSIVTVLGPIYKETNANNNSIVLRIVYGNTSFLFTGDAQTEEENSVIFSGQPLRSTVLKVAHHGSDSSTGYQFLREVMPQYAVISVGSDNSYGHPNENVLSRLRDAGARVFRTDMQGDIVCTSDGNTVYFGTARNFDANTLSGSGAGQNSDVQALFFDSSFTPSGSASERSNIIADPAPVAETYVLNTNSKKFHRSGCSSVDDMKEKNKQIFNGTRDEAIAMGYEPCKRCNP
ncbi:MAG: MBL fold metallo-hydrolase [Lachnospiraceae bacterium]|nr:MBL fold metallo-hydrolase [Lachnospiraceae bacterium]